MVYTTVALLALAGSAMARMPSSHERHAARIARRSGAVVRKTNPNQRLTSPTARVGGNETAQVSYSQNWSGAVISEDAGTWTAVSGQITMPTPKTPSGGSTSTEYSASAWVGIDGDTCQTGIWQTGVDFYVQGSSVQYDAWYEWYPDFAHDFSGISFSAGDKVSMSVTVTSRTSGKATIENISTGKTASKTITNSGQAICQQDAEWIVEDFATCDNSGNCSLVPFANFDKVHFIKSKATSAAGVSTPATAEIIEIRQNNVVKTKTTLHANGLTVKYLDQ